MYHTSLVILHRNKRRDREKRYLSNVKRYFSFPRKPVGIDISHTHKDTCMHFKFANMNKTVSSLAR